MHSLRTVAITGMGTINPIGTNVQQFSDGLRKGKNGIAQCADTWFALGRAWITNEEILSALSGDTKDVWRVLGRAGKLFTLAAQEAMSDAGLIGNIPEDNAYPVIIGMAGNQTDNDIKVTRLDLSQVGPLAVSSIIPDTITGIAAQRHWLRGANLVTTSACASSMSAIRIGVQQILLGDTPIAVVWGADSSLDLRDLHAFRKAGALSRRGTSTPFQIGRDGFVMSEWAGTLVLEELEHARNRGAKIYATIAGYGATSDATHITKPDSEARGYTRAMELAMERAGVWPEEVDVVNMHGTGTTPNDAQEYLGYTRLFGHLPDSHKPRIMAVKSQIGHTMGAAWVIEVIASVISLTNGFVPGIIDLKDPEWPLIGSLARWDSKATSTHLKMASWFWGHNEALIISAAK